MTVLPRGERRPAEVQAQELVNEVVRACLDGDRVWVRGCDETEKGFLAYLVTIMGSLLANRFTSAAWRCRVWGEGPLEDAEDGQASPLRVTEARLKLEQIERTLEGDEEALAFIRALGGGAEACAEHARERGWDSGDFTNERWRIERRLDSKGITWDDNDEDEAEARGAGPSGRHHDDSRSAGERRRAPGEHAGGAGRAGRRR